MRVVLINSEYYDGAGVRAVTEFMLTGLGCASVRMRRLTAASALSRQDYGDMPTFGRIVSNETCRLEGPSSTEHSYVTGGVASFKVAASEALLIEL